ncbi:Myocilin [Listeria cossartiae subsp. cayugensis]|uniref:Myocilin n=1 Tax=Listeria cossartiae TaxID=2838249 RepID=UPI0028802DB7|nr:Myocilin [Listeria cossartiae]MDT0001399.1 Myocilin [Listeria cossartiae subsp. cayugensis]MDT0009379.1 Myocilin [Listeria cossartiae subsp. cayugensis]MDT0031429.1 Myocilin [Listeria cossartiae subsp. cayugensis]MDT0039545.1 Myocilin [Listeria cossartiae subsp. cayugensis]MDT0044676.1 Myocilin [Listeria cossartiae subsp. cayugensis]
MQNELIKQLESLIEKNVKATVEANLLGELLQAENWIEAEERQLTLQRELATLQNEYQALKTIIGEDNTLRNLQKTWTDAENSLIDDRKKMLLEKENLLRVSVTENQVRTEMQLAFSEHMVDVITGHHAETQAENNMMINETF